MVQLCVFRKVQKILLLIKIIVLTGGVADRVGGLKRGDQLLSVNGVSVEGEHHEKAVELLKAAIGSVKLVVRYTPKVLEEMEMRFDKQRQARRRQIYTQSHSFLPKLKVICMKKSYCYSICDCNPPHLITLIITRVLTIVAFQVLSCQFW